MNKLDLYAILGISKDASSKEITSAYRRLALKYHPDRNKSPFANEMMLKINTAYDILSDPKKREEYDYSLLERKDILPEDMVENHSYNISIMEYLLRLVTRIKSKIKISMKIMTITIKRIVNFINSR